MLRDGGQGVFLKSFCFLSRKETEFKLANHNEKENNKRTQRNGLKRRQKWLKHVKPWLSFYIKLLTSLIFSRIFSDLSFCYKEKESCEKGQEKLNLGCKKP